MNTVHRTIRTRRDTQRDELGEEILAAARILFVREGYESFSMRKLAAAVGCSAGAIYNHFASKEVLFERIVGDSFRCLEMQQMRVGKTADPVASLKRGLRSYVDFGLKNPNDYRFAFLMQAAEVRRGTVSPAFKLLRDKVAICVDAKLFRTIDIDMAAQALWAAVHGVTSLLIMKPYFPWVEGRRLIDRVIDSAVDSLLAAPEFHGSAQAGISRTTEEL